MAGGSPIHIAGRAIANGIALPPIMPRDGSADSIHRALIGVTSLAGVTAGAGVACTARCTVGCPEGV